MLVDINEIINKPKQVIKIPIIPKKLILFESRNKLIAPILLDELDVVFGTRFPHQKRHVGQRYVHYLANRILTWLSNLTTGLALTDMETGYKVFRREILLDLQIEENRFGVEPELTAKLAKGGWRIGEVPVSYDPRTAAAGKKIGWRDGIHTLRCIFRYRS